MDIRRWIHVIAVADQRSFARAAAQIHLSQPALTRSIQAAEAELGLRLFDRGTHEITPTPAGEFVIARARQLVFNSRCLERDVALYVNHGLGDVAFGVGPFPAATFLPGLLARLRREFPSIRLRVEVSNWQLLFERLLAQDIEFFVSDTRDLPADPALLIAPLRHEAGGFFVRSGHPLSSHRTVSLRQLWEHGVASVRLPAKVRTTVASLLGLGPGEELVVALECDDIETLRRVVLASDTVLAAPLASVAEEVALGALRPVAVSGLPPLFSDMGVVTLRGRTPSPMAELIMGRLPTEGTKPKQPVRRRPQHNGS
jgi:DNA-binding transcriptional LysR family regulator